MKAWKLTLLALGVVMIPFILRTCRHRKLEAQGGTDRRYDIEEYLADEAL